jgi:hypothetical protein
MQLPRGKFHRIYKSVTLRSLTDELQTMQFTGYCTIAFGSESTILVYDRGQVLLAECGAKKGRPALDDVQGKWESEAAAELNILTPEQIELAREFNRASEIGTSQKNSTGRAAALRGESSASRAPPARVRATERPARPERTQSPPAVPKTHPPQGNAGQPDRAARIAQGQQEEVDTLVQMIEAMDIETLNSSFRTDCKELLRRIDLEHLIQDSGA